MKKLENYGVQDMSAQEIRETDGGWFPWVTISGGWFNTVNFTNYDNYV